MCNGEMDVCKIFTIYVANLLSDGIDDGIPFDAG